MALLAALALALLAAGGIEQTGYFGSGHEPPAVLG
jgi:hypothetical protein